MIALSGDMSLLLHSTTKGIVSSQISIDELLDGFIIDHTINRDINYSRIPDIVKYLESRDDHPGIFLPAFVFSYRSDPQPHYDSNSAVFRFEDKSLITIDGQHRVKAMQKYVEKHPDDFEFRKNSVTVQVYFGLSQVEEKQLFVDINSKAKRVSRSLVMKYDSREISNLLIQEVYRGSSSLKVVGIELEKSKVQRPGNNTFATGSRLKAFVSYLLFGKKSLSKSDERVLIQHYDQIITFLYQFFDELFDVLPPEPGDVKKYVLGHEPIQNALALYFHNSFVTLDIHGLQITSVWEDVVKGTAAIDWSAANIEWRRLGITKSTRQGQYLGFVDSSTPQLYEHIQGLSRL